MENIPNFLFHMEAAGSLAPDLEGAPVSARHQNRGAAKEHSHVETKQSDKSAQPPTGGGRA